MELTQKNTWIEISGTIVDNAKVVEDRGMSPFQTYEMVELNYPEISAFTQIIFDNRNIFAQANTAFNSENIKELLMITLQKKRVKIIS